MPIPGDLTRQILDPANPVITAECAIDQGNKLVILKDEPKITIPLGGVITIDQLIKYAFGQATNPITVSLLKTATIIGKGIREFLLRDTSIPDHPLALAAAVSKLAELSEWQYSHSFLTLNHNFEISQKQRLKDPSTGFDYYALVSGISDETVVSNGLEEICVYNITVSTSLIITTELIAKMAKIVFDGIPENKVQTPL